MPYTSLPQGIFKPVSSHQISMESPTRVIDALADERLLSQRDVGSERMVRAELACSGRATLDRDNNDLFERCGKTSPNLRPMNRRHPWHVISLPHNLGSMREELRRHSICAADGRSGSRHEILNACSMALCR